MSLRMRALAVVVLLAGGVAMPAPAAAADAAAVRAAIETAIRARLGAAAVVEIDTVQVSWIREAASVEATPDVGARLGAPLRFTLRTLEPGPAGPRVVVAGSAVVQGRVHLPHVHARQTLTPGTVLTEADLHQVTHHLTALPLKALPDASSLVGARVLRRVAADACIDGTAVALLHAVRSGQSVTAVSRFAGGEVSAVVVASEHGDPGRVIQVVNPQTRRALKARVLSAGVVEILP
jgi:flagella basal body P-ring formation protein FlgA